MGVTSGTASASGSLFAPLPAVGPTFRWYPVPDSSRFYLDGILTGMSFFGYGNFVSGNAVVAIRMSQHWNARAGYLLGSRLKVTGSNDRIAIRLTQKGPVLVLNITGVLASSPDLAGRGTFFTASEGRIIQLPSNPWDSHKLALGFNSV